MRKAIVLAAALVLTTTGDAFAATPTRLVDTDAPTASSDRETGWTAWSEYNGHRWIGYVRPDGGSRRKIPSTGDTSIGSIMLDGPRAGQVVFWNEGRIGFYDLATGELRKAPAGVNTRRNEMLVSGSGDYLLFGRGRHDDSFAREVILFRISTGRSRILARDDVQRFIPDDVNGDFAVWTTCLATTCRVTRRQISTGENVLVPEPRRGRAHYWSGVLPDGTVYSVDGSYAICGKNTRIVRWDGAFATIATVPDQWEIVDIHAWTDGVDSRVIFDRTHCTRFAWTSFEVLDDVA